MPLVSCLSKFSKRNEFIAIGKLHLEPALNAGSSQKASDVSGGEIEATAVLGDDGDRLSKALINAQVALVIDVDGKSNELTWHGL